MAAALVRLTSKSMIRPVLSLERLTFLEPEGKVGYRYSESEQEVMDYLEFIARATSHIPDKGQVMVRYYGLYANAHIYRSSEADVRRLGASALSCLRAGRAPGVLQGKSRFSPYIQAVFTWRRGPPSQYLTLTVFLVTLNPASFKLKGWGDE
jgi:hypothetical protein